MNEIPHPGFDKPEEYETFTTTNDLEEASNKFANQDCVTFISRKKGFKAGAEWQYQKDREEFSKMKAKTWCEGFDAHKDQMMKEAVEADVNTYKDLAAEKSWAEFVVEMPTNNLGDKVKLIVIKEDKK